MQFKKNNFTSRLGSMYRRATWETLGYSSSKGKILDVGCNDGYVLNAFPSNDLIGIDLTPKNKSHRVKYIQGDGMHLPFPFETFDVVICLDTIEHIENHKMIANELLRVLCPGGTLRISTPSSKIRFGTEFFTKWVSRRWGHQIRRGYTINKLENLFKREGYTIKSQTWNAPFFRMFYIPLWILHKIMPELVQLVLARISKWDSYHSKGNHGFYFLEVRNNR
jgi:2-polyprenyl-3-methyl-5-hydroxy-6-metoxy-1,4-benzoquinol methylase